jgi:hypothetical protein
MATLCNCDECVPDPTLTCSYTGDDVSVAVVYLANAYRGHLILSPGGANGQIGGLLHQLDPPQHYSHMGIMVADYDLIRHTTAVPARLTAEEYYTGSVLGVKAPADGLNPDHVQFGWPGSVTQSAEQVFLADRYGGQPPPGLPRAYTGSDLLDKESPSGRRYTVAALSFDPVSEDGVNWFPALVVKPCPVLETPAVTAALNRVADEAVKIYAHYRFYCYTQAIVADDPDYWRTPTEMPVALPGWDATALKWNDWSDTSFAAATTAGSPTVTVASPAPDLLGVGMSVSGAGIPAGTTVAAVVSDTTLTLSGNAKATGPWGLLFTAAVPTATTAGSPTVTLSVPAKLGVGLLVSGAGIPVGTTVAAVVSATTLTLSRNATATGSSVLAYQTTVPFATTAGSPTATLAVTAALSAGMLVKGTGIPDGTTVAAVIDGTTFTLSGNATATGTTTLACARTTNWVTVPTAPGVCSTFVWQAVQHANKAGGPKIVLDGAATKAEALGEAGGACRRRLPPDWAADTPGGPDGLYKYSADSRSRAANWLHDSLSDEVFAKLKENLADEGGVKKILADAIDDIGRGTFILAAVAGANALVSALIPLGGAVVAVIDLALAEQLIELLYDMPDDIANQVVTSFAFDCHRGFPGDTRCVDALGREILDVDSDNWDDAPGDGLTVSPDNTHMFWDAPGASVPREQVRGIYGYNTPVQPVVGVVRRPRCELLPSTGVATVQGYVRYRGTVVFGAYVKANCQHTLSVPGEPSYRLQVKAGGRYKVVARYEDLVRGKVLYGERVTGKPTDPPLAPGSVTKPRHHPARTAAAALR